MDAPCAPASTSPPCEDPTAELEWTLVERPEDAPATSSSARPDSPEHEAAADSAVDHDEQQDGMKSPASERLADDLLREPYQAGSQLHLQLALPAAGQAVEEPSTPTAAIGPYTSSCDNLALAAANAAHPAHAHRTDAAAAAAALSASAFAAAAAAGPSAACAATDGQDSGSNGSNGSGSEALCGWSFERHRERMRLRTCGSRASGEGGLEGTQEAQLGSAASGGLTDEADGAVASASALGFALRGWEALLSGLATDVLRQWAEMRAALGLGVAALGERIREAKMRAEAAVNSTVAAAAEVAKEAAHGSCPRWVAWGLGGAAVLAVVAFVGQVCANRRQAALLRQRDRDMARMVFKILNLQDALNAAYRSSPPLVRHTHTSCTTLIGMGM